MSAPLSLDAALEIINSKVSALQEYETISLKDALGRVLSLSIKAPYSLPAFDNTGVDGYAFRHSSSPSLKLSGASFAGEPFTGEVTEGLAVRIATGAVLPLGADTVVMQEDCDVQDGILNLKKIPDKGANIRRKGADIAEGDEVLPAGQILQPQHIAMLGALGLQQISVFRKIKIAIASTGLELKEHGSTLETGQIIDTNSLMLSQMVTAMAEATILNPLPDEYDETCKALSEAAKNYDLIITSGGVSVGDRDYVHAALKDLGQVHFWKLAIRPGKPLIFGQMGKCFMIGLPGNPVSSFVTYLLVVRSLLSVMTGRTAALPPAMQIPLAGDIKKDFPLRSFPRARLEIIDGQLNVVPYKDQSSNLFSSLTDADGLMDLSEQDRDKKAGEPVSFRSFTGWL